MKPKARKLKFHSRGRYNLFFMLITILGTLPERLFDIPLIPVVLLDFLDVYRTTGIRFTTQRILIRTPDHLLGLLR
jgi:hypothetical protein